MPLLSFLNGLLEPVVSFIRIFPGLREVIAFLLVFFLPGFCWTLFLFSKRQINRLERIALSFGLSISLVTLIIYAANRIWKIKITGTNSLFIILLLILVALVSYYIKISVIRQNRNRNNHYSDSIK